MASLRVRVELNKGGVGVSLRKLAAVSTRYEKFLKSLSKDLRIDLSKGEWIAKDFENSSVDYVVEFVGPTPPETVAEGYEALRHLMIGPKDIYDLSPKISRGTVQNYANIADDIDADEAVGFGLYSDGNGKPSESYVLSKELALHITEILKQGESVTYTGTIRGTIHSWLKEAERPHLRVRDFASSSLVDCYYQNEIYPDIADAVQRRETIIDIGGIITASRVAHRPMSILVRKISKAAEYQEGDLERFFGCAPDLTGNMTTEEFIDLMRQDD